MWVKRPLKTAKIRKNHFQELIATSTGIELIVLKLIPIFALCSVKNIYREGKTSSLLFSIIGITRYLKAQSLSNVIFNEWI